MLLEHKFFTINEFKADEANPRSFTGYGSVFDTVDSYGDTIVKGAFKPSLKEWKAKGKLPKLLLQHGGGGWFSQNADDLVPIGKWDEMREDDHGLFVRGHLFDVETDRTKAVHIAMKEGELDGLSIGFKTRKWKYDEETEVRTLTEIELWECSIVTFPANDPARIESVRSAGEPLPTERDFEAFLRDAGFSKRQAQAIVVDGFEHFLREGGFSAEEARSISRHGYRQVGRDATAPGDPEHDDVSGNRQVRRDAKPSEGPCADLLPLLNQRTALYSGDHKS